MLVANEAGISAVPGFSFRFFDLVQFQPVETAASRANPDLTLLVLVDGEHSITSQAVRVVRIVPVARKLLCCPIETIEAAAVGANPQRSRLVFVQCQDGIAAEAVLVVWVVFERPELVPIISV